MSLPAASDHKRAVGRRLRWGRIVAGYATAHELAGLMAIEPNTLTNWERGLAYPNPYYLPKWLEITQVPLDWVLAGDLRHVPYALALRLIDLEQTDKPELVQGRAPARA